MFYMNSRVIKQKISDFIFAVVINSVVTSADLYVERDYNTPRKIHHSAKL
jgi:hypothetical protein